MKKRLVVLISDTGTGTNLQAIIDSTKENKINAEIVAVISDMNDAHGLKRAKAHNLKIIISPNKEELLIILKEINPDFICLCGWKQFITKDVINNYPNKILNLHPGAIPDSIDGDVLNPDGTKAEWNKGKLTDVAIKNVLAQKNTYASSSIHFLTQEFDFGPVLERCFEKVEVNDTIDTLYTRLKKKENVLYISVLENICK